MSYSPLVTGHWSLVTGHWSLVTGHSGLGNKLHSRHDIGIRAAQIST
ncbi:hypothetical protein [Scytonema hofmannii]|nr:hypothetical protein [Scytonema hofmannii]